MKFKFLLALSFPLFIASMEQHVVNFEDDANAAALVAEMQNNYASARITFFQSIVKKYKGEPTDAVRFAILRFYDERNNAENEKTKTEYERILREKLETTIDQLRSVTNLQDGNLAENLMEPYERSMVAERLRMLKRITDHYRGKSDLPDLIKRVFLELQNYFNSCPFEYGKAAAHDILKKFYTDNPVLAPLVNALETQNMDQAIKIIREIEQNGTDSLNGVEFLLKVYLNIQRENFLINGYRKPNTAPAVAPANLPAKPVIKAWIKARTHLQGIRPLLLEKLRYFGKLLERFNKGEGLTAQDPMGVPLLVEDFEKLRDYVDVYIAGGGDDGGKDLLQFEKLGNPDLTIDNIAVSIKQAWDLGMDKILEALLDRFVELVHERNPKEFAETRAILLSFSFPLEVQEQLSWRFFTHDQQDELLSLMHSRLDCAHIQRCDAGIFSYLTAISTQEAKSSVFLLDAHNRETVVIHPQFLSRPFDKQVKIVRIGQTPLILICSETEAQLIDVRTGACKKRIPLPENSIDESIWEAVLSHDKTLIALGCGKKIVLYNIKTDSSITFDNPTLKQAQGGLLSFAHDNSSLFVASNDGALAVLDLNGSPLFTEDLKSEIYFFSSSANGEWIVASREGKKIGLSMKNRELRLVVEPVGEIICADQCCRTFATKEENCCSLWDLDSKFELVGIPGMIKACFSHDARFIAIITDEHSIEIYEREERDGKSFWKKRTKFHGSPKEIFFTADDQHLVVLEENCITIWHYFDERLSYIRKPMEMVQAFVFSHCLRLLRDNEKEILKRAPALLEGPLEGSKSLLKLALDEEDSPIVVEVAENPGAAPQELEEPHVSEAQQAEDERTATINSLLQAYLAMMAKSDYKAAADILEELWPLREHPAISIITWYQLANLYDGTKQNVEKNLARRRECLEYFVSKDARNLDKAFVMGTTHTTQSSANCETPVAGWDTPPKEKEEYSNSNNN